MVQQLVYVSHVHPTMSEQWSRLNDGAPCILLTYRDVPEDAQRAVGVQLRQLLDDTTTEQDHRRGFAVVRLNDDVEMRAGDFRSGLLGTLRQLVKDQQLGIVVRS